MSFALEIKEEAKQRRGSVILPEGDDERMLPAAGKLIDSGIAERVFLLNCDERPASDKIEILEPARDKDCEEMAHRLANNNSELSLPEAEKQVKQPLNYAAGLVAMDRCDAMVAGAANPTANVLRAALNLVGTAPDTSLVSSSFIMELDDYSYGQEGKLLFTDPAVVPDPDAEQLVEMAAGAVGLFENLIEAGEPAVAFLSFSTRGSADHPLVDKVSRAAERFSNKFPALASDGELQADAALVPDVAERKAPDSPLNGDANILVFPDLNAANIGYKLVQRLAGAGAYGPILQGLNGAINDLSRGCSVEDIITVSAITLVQGTSRE